MKILYAAQGALALSTLAFFGFPYAATRVDLFKTVIDVLIAVCGMSFIVMLFTLPFAALGFARRKEARTAPAGIALAIGLAIVVAGIRYLATWSFDLPAQD